MSMRTHDLATEAVVVDIEEQRSTVDLSVVIPAFREGHRIHQNLGRLVDALNALGVGYEVIVVSDGNTDSTASEARRDMELDPANIKVFMEMMQRSNCDAVIGSKRHPDSKVSYPAFRRLQSSVYQLLVRALFGLAVRDTQTGLKLFRRQVLSEAIPLLAIKRFAFDLELLVVSRFLGYRNICEAPITLNYKFESTVDLRAAWWVLWDTAAIWYRLRIRNYYQHRRRQVETQLGDGQIWRARSRS